MKNYILTLILISSVPHLANAKWPQNNKGPTKGKSNAINANEKPPGDVRAQFQNRINLGNSNGLKAHECYNIVREDASIFSKIRNSPHTTIDTLEDWAMFSCTYSDFIGFNRCYQQAIRDPNVFTSYGIDEKFDLDWIAREKQVGWLCKASREKLLNIKTGEADAYECFKAVKNDVTLLPNLRNYGERLIENEIRQLCIDSNALGAVTCLKNADRDFKRNRDQFGDPVAREKAVVKSCRKSKIR